MHDTLIFRPEAFPREVLFDQSPEMPAGEAETTCRPVGVAGAVVSPLGLTVSVPGFGGIAPFGIGPF